MEAPKERRNITDNKQENNQPKKPIRKEEKDKIKRNEKCPCGSGKKYKNCCYKKESNPYS
jgi:preprotein translocase subunit SecA